MKVIPCVLPHLLKYRIIDAAELYLPFFVFFLLGVRVISNAGGINPLACAAALQEVAKKADVDLKIAVVSGDDLMSEVFYFVLSLSRTNLYSMKVAFTFP